MSSSPAVPLRTVRPRPLLSALARRGSSVTDCAEACGVTTSLVYAWDQGARRPAERHAPTLRELIGEVDTARLYELTTPGPGRGQLPRTSRAIARATRAVCAELQRKGAHDIARLVRGICAPIPATP